ncbi:MAG: hypothetical protein ACYS80_14155, partial [Planctomycetota bacterium]
MSYSLLRGRSRSRKYGRRAPEKQNNLHDPPSFSLERLEARLLLSVVGGEFPTVDLIERMNGLAGYDGDPQLDTAPIVAGAIYTNDIDIADIGAGSGVIQSFVRRGKETGQGDPATKQGYNTSGRPVQYEENTSPSFTHDLPLASIPLFYYDVDLDGTPEAYYEFRLDINESDTNLARWLSVDAIQIWQSDTPGLHSGFIPATDHADQTSYTGSLTVGFTSDGDSYLVYNMDEGDVNNWVAMNYTLNEGSGVADMVLLVPVEFFNQDLEFVYLYSQFGAQTGTSDIEWDSNGDFIVDQTLYGRTWEQDDGFEEWAITAEIPGTKSGIKFLDLNGDGIRDADGIDNIPDNADDEVGLAGWTIYVYEDEDASGLLDSGETNLVASVLTANGTTDDLDGDGVIDPVGFYWFELESVTLKEVKVKGEVVGYTP